MSAPITFSKLNVNERKDIAKKLFKTLTDNLKKFKETNGYTTTIDVCQVGHGFRPWGSYVDGDYIDYRIKYGTDEWKGLGELDVKNIGIELDELVNMLKAKKGYGMLIVETSDIMSKHRTCWGMEDYVFGTFPTKFTNFGTPCKEFKTLQKLLEKRFSFALGEDKCYEVRLFGKNGRYNESGNRSYLCYSPNWCNSIINNIKVDLKGKRNLEVSLNIKDDIDTDYSSKYLTECYGTRYVELNFNKKN